jgi:hypothetical protein
VVPHQTDPNGTNPPYHLVNSVTSKHHGPFSTYLDAVLARYIGTVGWPQASIMDKDEFAAYLGD